MDTSRIRALVLLAVVFAAGAVVGVATDRLDLLTGVAKAEADEPVEAMPAEPDERDGERRGRQTAIEEFADELGLTVDQRARIEEYLDHFREGARMLQRDVRPRYRALMDSVRTEIESVLTEAQVEDYRELLRQRYGEGGARERGRSSGDDPEPTG